MVGAGRPPVRRRAPERNPAGRGWHARCYGMAPNPFPEEISMTASRLARAALSIAVLAGALAASRVAAADTLDGYVCNVTLNTSRSLYGAHGYILVVTSANPDCIGTSHFTYLCSTGATHSSCTTEPSYLLSESGLDAVFQAIQRAAAWGQRVTVGTDPGVTYAGRYVTFRR